MTTLVSAKFRKKQSIDGALRNGKHACKLDGTVKSTPLWALDKCRKMICTRL